MTIRRYVEALLIAAALIVVGCGASAKQSEEAEKCLQQCNLGSIECMESLDCTDMSGQLIPCDVLCEQERSECEKGC